MSKDYATGRIKVFELFSMWDYEGKLESTEWSRDESIKILRAQTLSPPAKMIRLFLSKSADAMLQEVVGTNSSQHVSQVP